MISRQKNCISGTTIIIRDCPDETAIEIGFNMFQAVGEVLEPSPGKLIKFHDCPGETTFVI